MDEHDNGSYQFDPNYPPFFIKPPEHLKEPIKRMMENAIPDYLKTCSKEKHHHEAMLDSGLIAGEAGWLCQRMSCQRRSTTHKNKTIDNEWLFEEIKKNLPIDFDMDKEWEILLRNRVMSQVFTYQCKRQVTRTVKAFLKDIGVDAKGLRKKLEPLITTIQNHVKSQNV